MSGIPLGPRGARGSYLLGCNDGIGELRSNLKACNFSGLKGCQIFNQQALQLKKSVSTSKVGKTALQVCNGKIVALDSMTFSQKRKMAET